MIQSTSNETTNVWNNQQLKLPITKTTRNKLYYQMKLPTFEQLMTQTTRNLNNYQMKLPIPQINNDSNYP